MKMLKIISICIILLFCMFQMSAQTIKEIPIKAHKLGDRILFLKIGETSMLSNILAVSTEKGLVVMDTGLFPGIAARARKIIEREFGRKDFAYVISTHGAIDHIAGNQVFSNAIIIAHDNSVITMKQQSVQRKDPNYKTNNENSIKELKELIKKFKKDSYEAKSIRELIFYFVEKPSDFILTIPHITFSNRMSLYLDDLTLRMVHNVNAYSDSDIIIHIPELKLLNVGDIFNNDRLPIISDKSDITRWLEIFREYLDKEDEIKYVIGGHGGVMTIDEVRDHLTYVKDLYEGVSSALKEGITNEKVKEMFAFNEFNHLNHIKPTLPGIPINIHSANIESILKMLEK